MEHKEKRMTTDAFKEYVKTRRALDTEEIHRFMDDMSNEAPAHYFPAEYSIPHTGRSTRITFRAIRLRGTGIAPGISTVLCRFR